MVGYLVVGLDVEFDLLAGQGAHSAVRSVSLVASNDWIGGADVLDLHLAAC